LGADRFNTLLGLIFLAIVLISPGGLVGAWEQARDRIRAAIRGRRAPPSGPAGDPQEPIDRGNRVADQPGLP